MNRESPLGDAASLALVLSIPIAVLAVSASLAGIVFESTIYAEETDNWRAQGVAQDIANVTVAYPALALLAFVAWRGSLWGYLAWTGALGYSVYTFALYAFAVHFGPVFLLYVAAWGFSVYALILALLALDAGRVKAMFESGAPARLTGGLLVIIGTAFMLLWLSEVVPGMIENEPPEALVDAGLPTNPVHVLDLGVFLPAVIITGVLLLRGHALGYYLAPLMLGTTVLLGIGIIFIQVVVSSREEDTGAGLAFVFAAVVVAELVVLWRFLRSMRPGAGWRAVRPQTTDAT